MGESETKQEKPSRLLDNFVSGLVNLIFSKEKKIERGVLLLTLIGFILRLIGALNLGVKADDMLYASQSAGIWSTHILSTHSNPPLFYYLTDLAYRIFGYTTFASRFWPLMFGTLLIPLCFLIAKRLFNKKVGFFAAFFVTFSTFLIRMTFTEQSLVAVFFNFFAVYFGLVYLENKKLKLLLVSASLFGMACLTKYNAPFFILAFLAYSAYYFRSKNEKVFSSPNIKHFLLFLLVIFIFCLPFLSFNYFIFKDNGILDVYFSRVIKLDKTQELYAGFGGQENSFFDNLVNIKNYHIINLLYKSDIVILLFGLLGLFFMFKEKQKNQLIFLLLFFMIPFILQSAGAPLQKHFSFMSFVFSIPAGLGLSKLWLKINRKMFNLAFLAVIVIAMVVVLGTAYGSPDNYFSKSYTSGLKSYVNSHVSSGDVIVFDPRIYTAQAFWMGTPNHFLNFFQFAEFYNYNANLSNSPNNPIKIHLIECAVDDCGWGTIKDQPELNQSSESILESLKGFSEFTGSVSYIKSSGNEILSEKENVEEFRMYSSTINLHPELVKQIDSINTFYMTPYMYKNMDDYFYNYDLANGFDRLLEKLSWWIIFLSVILSFVFMAVIVYCIISLEE